MRGLVTHSVLDYTSARRDRTLTSDERAFVSQTNLSQFLSIPPIPAQIFGFQLSGCHRWVYDSGNPMSILWTVIFAIGRNSEAGRSWTSIYFGEFLVRHLCEDIVAVGP